MIAELVGMALGSTVGRWLLAGAGAIVGATLIYQIAYWKGYIDGRASYRMKIEREIQNAVRKGDQAREKALRDFDALPDDGVPDDGFRRD